LKVGRQQLRRPEGLVVTVRGGKTDPEGPGRKGGFCLQQFFARRCIPQHSAAVQCICYPHSCPKQLLAAAILDREAAPSPDADGLKLASQARKWTA
jgi:hypothetical protein